jgi:hypothetical protein
LKKDLREKAIQLRTKGNSYSYIKNELKVSKSTLSYWLRTYPLSRERINELRATSEVRIEKYRQTMLKKRSTRLEKTYGEEKEKWLPLSEREIYLAGLFLYWGEGSKTTYDKICISNTDPSIIKFAMHWLIYSLGIQKESVKVALHLYSDMDVNETINFWSRLLVIDTVHFSKPFIKRSSSQELTHKGYGHGTCSLIVHNTSLKEKILMDIKVMADKFNNLTK